MNKTKKVIIIIASIVVFAGLIGGIVFLVGMLRNKTAEQEVIAYQETITPDGERFEDKDGDGYSDWDEDILQQIIDTQIASGSDLKNVLAGENYSWNENGRLQAIYWTNQRLVGEVSFAGLDELNTVIINGTFENPNFITHLDVKENKNLVQLDCSYSNLFSLDISGLDKLTMLICNGNAISELRFNGNVSLEMLDCCKNNITILDLSQTTGLKFLLADDNRLETLDCSACPKLYLLACTKNQITKLDLTKNSEIYTLETDPGVEVIK